MSEPSPRRTLALPVAVFLALVAVRLPVAVAHQGIWYPFEIFSGHVAAALLDGLDLDVARLTIIGHIRGGPLFGLLLAPLYALLGETTLVMKLVPLLWHALTVALLVGALQRFACRKAALGVGLAFVCAPPIVTKLSVLCLASHQEASLPIVLALIASWRIVHGGRHGSGAFALLGLALGFCGFFHLQALLGGLIVAGLTLLAEPRACLRGLPACLAGAALGGAPSWLFEGSALNVISESAFGSTRFSPAQVTEGADNLRGTLPKLMQFVREGLAPMLEYGQLGETAGRPVAYLVGWIMVGSSALVAWWERHSLLGLFPRLVGRGRRAVGALSVFPLHGLAVLGLLVVSQMQLNLWFVGTGLANRRLAPLFFAATVMTGLVLGQAFGAGRLRWPARIALALYTVCGLWGTWAASQASGPDRMAVRGEFYEWFAVQLHHDAGDDFDTALATLARIDRGDRRFRPLRFKLPGTTPPPRAPLSILGQVGSPDLPLEERLFRLVALGRTVGADASRAAPRELAERLPTLKLRGADRVALLHGVGMGTVMRRPAVIVEDPQPPAWLKLLAGLYRGPDQRYVFEGFGFAQGLVYDPYNRYMNNAFVSLGNLPPGPRRAFFLGMGWGVSQRYVETPGGDMTGLTVLRFVPEDCREDFLAGLRRETLPAEARALAGGDG